MNVLNGHSREGTDASASDGWQESRPKTQKALTFVKAFAVWTGLEPATPCVTGRYSNQLNYQTFILKCSSLYFFELTGKLEYLRSATDEPLFVVQV